MYCFVLGRVNGEEKCNGWQLPSDRRVIMTERSGVDCRVVVRDDRLNIEHVDVCLNHGCILFVLLYIKRLDGVGPIEGPFGRYALLT